MDSRMDSRSLSPNSSTRLHGDLPFQDLPNLPKPIIPKIDLGIKRIELEALLQIRPSLESFRTIGHSVADHATQTDESDILDLKYIIEMLGTLTLDTGQLRKDLNFAQSVLKANYEKQISDRSTELYCRMNERLCDLEKQQRKKMETVRKSYQAQFDDAIQAVAGDYRTYYNEILQGKTGRHDLIIQELKDQLVQHEILVRQQEARIHELQTRIEELEELNDGKQASPNEPPGISLEEAEQLESQISDLKEELQSLKHKLAVKEDECSELGMQTDMLNKQLNDQKGKYKQLEKDMDSFKQKAQQEKEKAAKLAESQLAAMEKEMKMRTEQAEKEAAQKAQEQAELQRMKDQAKFHEEMERRKSMEEQLRAQAAQQKPTDTIGDEELLSQIRALEETEKKLTNTISRLEKELEKTNKMWELKLAVMRKSFHALKDEFYIRHTLKRQSATLQHSTVGYAVSGDMHMHNSMCTKKHLAKETKPAVPALKLNSLTDNDPPPSADVKGNACKSLVVFNESTIPTIPPPSPNTISFGQSPRFVHFGDEFSPLVSKNDQS